MNAYVDANVFFLATFGSGEKSGKAEKLLRNIEDGRTTGITCSLALDELMWAVLKQKKGYRLAEAVGYVYALPNMHVVDTPAHAPLEALKLMEEYGLRPRDAIHAAVMKHHGLTTIYSDDADFDRVKGIKRTF